MNYFTKEELEEIAKELLENPSRETLNKLNQKYNGNNVTEESTSNFETTPVTEPVTLPLETAIPTVKEPVVESVSDINETNVDVNPINNSTSSQAPEVPSFEIPKFNTPSDVVQNQTPVNFTGNIFDAQPAVQNLMQTTDNFNSVPNTVPTTEVPVAPTPFFGPHVTADSNPIPVGGPVNNMPVAEPSMFGQLEQNYM